MGMKHDEAVALIQKHGGIDITPGLALVGPKGEHPLYGYNWSFRDYDAIIELSPRDGKLDRLSYWTKKDFRESKSHRVKTEQSISTLKLDTVTKGVFVDILSAEAPKHSYRLDAGYVPDAQTAVKVAVAVWEPIYGKTTIARQKPYNAKLTNGVWTVEGTFHGSGLGGVAVAQISKDDGTILKVSHGK